MKLLALAEKLASLRSHFLSPLRIAELFHYPNVRVRGETGKFNAWVIVEKESNHEQCHRSEKPDQIL